MGKLDDINHAYITAMSKMTDEVNFFERFAVPQKSADKKNFLTDLTAPLEKILAESASTHQLQAKDKMCPCLKMRKAWRIGIYFVFIP